MINTPTWHRVKELVEAALARSPAERQAFILERCGTDSSLRVEVESLLAAIDQAGNFIEQPALPAGWMPNLGGRALEPGNSFGHYTILEFVGAGGMGEVYRARDTNLNRDVALKVRPAAFALGADRFARFRREAQILAALNHPNVASIYGLENSDGIQGLVLELVDGPTLAGRISKSRISAGETLAIARQIADGLEAAHKRGIIHSDLKPANIKLRPDGSVKILDFGLARALDAVDAGAASSQAAPVTNVSVSQSGLIFGTAAYMSPEQARGEPVDKRTDIWAFGCVLYEMLTGHPAFEGKDIEEILAAVLNREPDWTLVPAETPVSIVKLLHKCLQKNPDRRLHDIADARIEIEDADTPLPIPAPQRQPPTVAILSVIATIALSLAVWAWLRPPTATEVVPAIKRLQIRLPEAGTPANAWSLPMGFPQLLMAISPDDTRVVYVLQRQGGAFQLYLHELDKLEPKPIPGTEGAFGPFFSPDGRWIGFFAENKLKKVAVSGGEPIELAAAPNAWGGCWGTDGTILFAVDEGRRPTIVPENGGIARAIVRIGRGSYRRPDILPGGKAAIVSNPLLGVGVLSLETGEFRLLVPDAGGGRYMPGHLVFARPGVLLAAPFDLDRLAVTGPETVVLESVRTELEGVAPEPQAAFSRQGTLVYAQGGAPTKSARPVWVDRLGKVQPLGMPPRSYRQMRLSPDGRLLAIIIADPRIDVWVQDLERGTLSQRTFDAEPDTLNWTPDGKRIAFGSRRNGRGALSIPRDGISEPEPFVVGSFSPDGKLVATMRGNPTTGLDLWVHPVTGPRAQQPFLQTRFTEGGPQFSPDGRWISYGSDESGQYEIYVRPYPGPGGKWQVSTEGGVHALWSRDGKEMFYRNGSKFMSVPVTLAPEFTVGKPHLLFEGPYVLVGSQSYDVSPDGQRFLVLEPVEKELEPLTHLNVVLNWFEDVKHRVGAVSPGAPR
jgi:eukaryotic-like serine/threonine-protein kinase